MPGLSANQVTLGEVLEVRGSPMHEDELWAVLYESCDSIKDVLLRGNMVHLQKVLRALNLENVVLCSSGKIKFGTELYDDMLMDRRFIAPERFMTRPEEVNDLGLEKMFIYTLGMVIYAAAQFGNGSVAELCLSSELETLLLYMCEDDPACRCNLVQVFQACNCRKGIYLSVERVKSMVKSILGSDLPLDEASPISDKLSSSSSILKVFSPTIDYSHPLPLSSIQPLTPLSSARENARENETTNGKETGNGVNGSLDAVSRRPKLQTYQSRDLSGSEERYEALIKDPKKDHHPKSVTIEERQPVLEDTINRTQSNPQESFLTGLPPIKKVASLPRDETKSNSTYSTSRFKRLLTTEKRKLVNDGFFDENRSRIKFADDRYKSMPTLNSAEVESPRSGKESIRSAEFPPGQQKGTYRKLTRFASKDSMDSASLATSQYSSAMSLNYGSYTLGSQNDMRRPFSFHGGSSNDGSAFNGLGSFDRMNEPRGSGPEFILFPQTPELSVVDITPARLGPMPRGRRKLSVMLPTAQRLETAIEASAIAKEVFDQVTEYLGLKETMYFGLTQIKESEHMFLDLESKLTKYAPSGWKDDKKNRIDFILHFKVKFFIENVGYLRHYTTRHMFYLQLRREILCGYVFCPDEAAISLGSLALQAEFHDYVERFHGRCYFEADHYLPGRVLGRMTKADIYHQLPLLHHSYRGLREDEAEMKFLKEARKLREYGMLFYQVSRSKKEPMDSCLLGICVKGIILFEVRGQIKTEIHRQYWHMIKKFSFTRKKFVVEPKKGIGLPMLMLYASNYKKAKYLLRMCQSFHRFSQLYQPRNPPSDSGSLIYSQKSSCKEEAADPQKEDKVPNTSELHASEDTPVTSELASQPQEHGAISKFSARNGEVEDKGAYEPSPVLPPKSGAAPSGLRVSQLPRTLENDAEIEKTVQQMFDEEILKEYSPRTRRRLSTLKGVPERVIENIILQRSPGQSLGITIVGGEDSNRLGSGIFIKNIISGGLVARNGRLQKGDRILSVNGTSLNQATHDEAAEILRNATGEIRIIVSQFRSQGTSFLDQTGISMASEDLPRTPATSKVAESTKLDDHKMEDIENLSLSPIATEGSSYKNPSQTEGTPKKSGKRARDKVVTEDEIDFQEMYPEESHMFMEKDQQLNSTPSLDTKSNNRNSAEKRTEDHFDTMEVTVRKSGNSFGINITGGTGSPFDGIYVQSITPNGPVDMDGRIRIGDCLLHVNGVDISKVTHKQAVKVLQNAPVHSKLLISRAHALPAEELQVNHAKPPIDMSRMSGDESSRSSKSSAVSTKDTFIVKIDKGMGGLGLSLAGGVASSPEFKDRIMVKRLFPGQPAAACGKLRIGDIILAVNGAKVAGYTQQEAINLLRRVKQTVKILVKRPHPNDIPEELLVETPRETLDPSSILKNIQTRISEEAEREMPHPPKMEDHSDADQFSLESYGHQRQGTNAEEIIPYPEKITTLQAVPNMQESISPKHISPHEVLVHAQISGPRQRRVPSESGSLSGEITGDHHENSVSLSAFSQGVIKNPVDKTSVVENINEALFEHEQLPLDFGEFDGPPEGEIPDELHVVEAVSQDQSSHDLSLPNLPSAEEMAGLKLPDPVFSDSQMLPLETSNYEVISKARSEKSSITDPDISSEEDGLILKIDPLKEKSLATDIANEPKSFQTSVENVEVNCRPKIAESSLLASKISSQASAKELSNNPEEPKSLYFEISLEKKDMGLGVVLKGGKNTTGCCFIQEIISDPALSCGQLQAGDEIVMVNSVDIGKYEHIEAVDFLRKTKGLVKLGIRRHFKSEKSNEKLLGFEMVTLERNSRGRHGLILDEENGEIIVGDTVPEEPASLTGNLRHGDLIKEINDISLEGVSLYDANTILEEANPIVQLAILRKSQKSRESRYAVDERERKLSAEKRKMSGDGTMPRLENGAKLSFPFARSNSWRSDSSVSSSPKKSSVTSSPVLKRLEVAQDSGQGFRLKTSGSQEDKGELIIVQLQKGSSGLGMSLTSHNDFGDKSGAFIANISPGGIAAKAGKLRSGDKVISINGENVERKHQREVVEILRKASGETTLEVFRHPMKLFASMDRGSSIASSDQRDADDLADMDFHFTEEANHADVEFEPDKLLLLLPDSNDEGATLKQDYENGIKNQVDFQKIMKEDSGSVTNSDFDGAKTGCVPSNKNHKPDIGLSVDFQSEAKPVIESQKNSHQSIRESFKSSRSFPPVSENNAISVNNHYNDTDLSWNDSEVSDEEHSKPSEEDKNLGEPIIGKSSISTSVVTKRPTAEKVTGIGNSQEVSFSSTLEKVTPSSSVVSSTLGEISPVSCSDEENSDFEFSSSAIPDLSSFTLEDKEAFDKLYGAKERTLPANENVEAGKIETFKEIGVVRHEEQNSEENTIEPEERRNTSIPSEVSDMDRNVEHRFDNEGLNSFGGRVADINDSNIENDSVLKGFDSHLDDSLAEDLSLKEADSTAILMALEEFEVREKEEFNDTLKAQIDNERSHCETSFIAESATGEVLPEKTEENFIKQSPSVDRKIESVSKIPKLDNKQREKSSSPLPRFPGKSNIPILTSTKSKNNIELIEKNVNTVKKPVYTETTFTERENANAGSDKDVFHKFEMNVELDPDSDNSFETDDDLALSLTRGNFSFGQEELDAKISHFQAILNSDIIDREFQEVKDVKATDSCDIARRSANRDKNRFRSILPFDKTRVCLAGGEEKDYINASHIKFETAGMTFHYIAAQGPLSTTVDDFWRMVWEQKVDTVVMVTKDVEGGKIKCHRYWPDLPGLPLKAADRFRIELVHRKENGNHVERQFSLTNTKLNKSFIINHILFHAWPETGLPSETLPLLMFVKNSTKMHSSGPILVHCSAGTGRTGLFIITDMLNKILPTDADVDVLSLVKSLKQQRQSLLQTKEQYIFCYKMAIEVLNEEKHLTY